MKHRYYVTIAGFAIVALFVVAGIYGFSLGESEDKEIAEVQAPSETTFEGASLIDTRVTVYGKLVDAPRLSNSAREIAALLDEDKFIAAEELLTKAMADSPGDAGLHMMKARYLAESDDLVWDHFIGEDTTASKEYWREVQASIQFDDEWWPYAAHLTLGSIAARVGDLAANGNGFVHTIYSAGNGLAYRYHEQNVGIVAYVIDCARNAPEQAREWAARFRSLSDDTFSIKMVSSSVVMSFSAAMLENAGDVSSAQDRATSLLVRAARNSASFDDCAVTDALELYSQVFGDSTAEWLRSDSGNKLRLQELRELIKEDGRCGHDTPGGFFRTYLGEE